MKYMTFLGVVAVLFVSAQGEAFAVSGNAARVVVKVRSGSVSAAATDTGGHVVARVSPDTVVVSVPVASGDATVAALRARPDVAWAERDVQYHSARTPNDPCFASTCQGFTQYGLTKIHAPKAWDVTTGDPTVKIALLDSGVDVNHPDLRGRVTVGPNFSGTATTTDQFGHGTHVAGILGAVTNNGVGVAGIDWNASILSVKVLDDSGFGTGSGIAIGLRYAADQGARIVNLSLGGGYSQTMADAVAYAESRGVLVVAAADNSGSTVPEYPAALPGVLSVGASDQNDALASFSNRGSWVDVVAPGVNIVSTWPTSLAPGDPYAVLDGTSMSSPLVAGAAALVWSARPYLSWSGVEERLMETSVPVAGTGTLVNAGRIDVGAALSNMPGGYRLVAADGGIFSFGASFQGSTGGERLNSPIVTAATPGNADGYWLVGSDGGVFTFGHAAFFGSTGGEHLNAPVVAIASTGSGEGYWLCASDGGIFSFGDAPFFGSTGGQHLNAPIVAVLPTATGRGYWLVAADGGIFSFGDAPFYGSTGGQHLNRAIVGAARTYSGNGYWLVAADGGIFSFGDAAFYGSTGGQHLAKPIVSMSASPSGFGYWLVGSDGGVFSFGDAPFLGSTGGDTLNKPIITSIG